MNKIDDFFNNKIQSFEYVSKSEKDTIEFAKKIARFLKNKDVLVLNGELGAGKTVFMSGIASYFDIDSEISSPTFSIVNEYTLKEGKNTNNIGEEISKIFHFDVYRIKDISTFVDEIGIDYFDLGLCIIEWGNIIKDILPSKTIYIDFEKNLNDENENIRILKIYRK